MKFNTALKRVGILNLIVIGGFALLFGYSSYLNLFSSLMPFNEMTQGLHFLYVVGFMPLVWGYVAGCVGIFKYW
ncbi:hypothetical protein LZS85_15730 [Aliivibrio fischeri]|uniref:hypothetical protein n=1 Tax=Aliivibrio fischeri TaxID=668 RepID=UPI001F386F7E|nr:hypothetical protein [Aliivibrio fischeri]MCE7567574.1 hypothetical protein [Aliivibrio fischeri]